MIGILNHSIESITIIITMDNNDLYAGIREALSFLPYRFKGRWPTVEEGWQLLCNGSLENLEHDQVFQSLRGSGEAAFPRDRFNAKRYLKFVGTVDDRQALGQGLHVTETDKRQTNGV